MPKKVLLVHVPYQFSGGEESHVETLKKSYAKIGITVISYTFQANDSKKIVNSLLPGQSIEELDQLWLNKDFDFIHANNIFPSLGPKFLRWVKNRKIPMLMTIHNHRFFCTNGLALRDGKDCSDCMNKKIMWRSVLHNCNQNISKTLYHSLALTEIKNQNLYDEAVQFFIAPSAYIADALMRDGYKKEKIIQVLHPTTNLINTTDLPNPLFDVFYAGRLSYEKGIETLLKSAQLAPNLSFVIAGKGPLESLVKTTSESSKNIKYVGILQPEEVSTYLSKSKIGVLPSNCNEILSLFALETFYQGKYCVMSESPSALWFKDNGYPALIAERGNAENLLQKINTALKKEALEKASIENFQKKLGIERFCNELRAVVERLFYNSTL